MGRLEKAIRSWCNDLRCRGVKGWEDWDWGRVKFSGSGEGSFQEAGREVSRKGERKFSGIEKTIGAQIHSVIA